MWPPKLDTISRNNCSQVTSPPSGTCIANLVTARTANCSCTCLCQGRVLSGHKDALDLAQRAAAAKGALKVLPLAVSGAFHSPLMKPAQEALVKARAP